MSAFNPKGALLSFTAASSAPTSVQAVSLSGEKAQQYLIINIDSTNDVTVGFGATDAAAKLAAAAGADQSNCVYVLHATQTVITGPANAYFSGIASASTAVVKVQAGIAYPS